MPAPAMMTRREASARPPKASTCPPRPRRRDRRRARRGERSARRSRGPSARGARGASRADRCRGREGSVRRHRARRGVREAFSEHEMVPLLFRRRFVEINRFECLLSRETRGPPHQTRGGGRVRMAPHPARDGGRGGDGGRGARKPKVSTAPAPESGSKLAQLARNENGGAHLPPWTPPAAVSALLRVWRELPELQRHRAPRRDRRHERAPAGREPGARRSAKRPRPNSLRCRRAFLRGAPPPARARAGRRGVPGARRAHCASGGRDGGGGRYHGKGRQRDENERRRGRRVHRRRRIPRAIAAGRRRRRRRRWTPAMSRRTRCMFRSGAIAEAVLRALRLPPMTCARRRCATACASPRAPGRAEAASRRRAAPAADLGIRRCDERHLEKQNDVSAISLPAPPYALCTSAVTDSSGPRASSSPGTSP